MSLNFIINDIINDNANIYQNTIMQSAQFNGMSPRILISFLLTSLSTPPSPQTPAKDKSSYLTLYALFEKEFLPALDCLDRGLVTHLYNNNTAAEKEKQEKTQQEIYLVRSAQQHHTRRGPSQNTTYYEVRLTSWNCSCPAFTFSAFPTSAPAFSSSTSDDDEAAAAEQNISPPTQPDIFGGLTKDSKGGNLLLPPVCKHLLACVLGKYCEGFGGMVEEKEVSREELGGWAAGWGD